MDTIAAIATPPGRGGIGIVKISGSNALSIAAAVFQRSSSQSPLIFQREGELKPGEVSFKSHRLYHGFITDSDRVIDEVLIAVMKAPHSYTREDVVEIHAHSGTVVLRTILDLVLRKGARLAEPGEFTKRAFLNGRIDLTQAEAVMDLIHAKSVKAAEMASVHMRGGFKNRIEAIRDALIQILAQTEAAIDFPDDIEEVRPDDIVKMLQTRVIEPLNGLMDHYRQAHFFRDGVTVCIAGRPNVGKSSLLNELVQKDRAIVTSIPGTTRDIIEEIVPICGIPAILTDTAGLRESSDPVELIGVQKAWEALESADLVLLMIDAGNPFTTDDVQIFRRIGHHKSLLVINKSDLIGDDQPLNIPQEMRELPWIRISAKNRQGINELKELIAQTVIGQDVLEADAAIPNLRHKLALERSLNASLSAIGGIQHHLPFEVINIDIRESLQSIGEIIGETAQDDILDQIFSRFCIGK